MKKIFTLLFAVGLFAAAQAQPGNRDNRQTDQRNSNDFGKVVVNDHNPYNDDFRNNNRFGDERRMKMEIAQINREYDFSIQKVRNSFFLFRSEKQRQIRLLEQQRQREINRVTAQFNKKYKKQKHYGNGHY